MKKINLPLSIVSIVALFLFTHCSTKDMNVETVLQDCTFIQDDSTNDGFISDLERSIMIDCHNEQQLDKAIVSENLVGTWELIGHGEGCIATTSQPCSSLFITEDEIEIRFKNASIDTVSRHFWHIVKIQSPSFEYLQLNLNPIPPVWLGLNTFCDQYMYGDATPSDGNMYLFEKIQ